jgi:hypothetical protein
MEKPHFSVFVYNRTPRAFITLPPHKEPVVAFTATTGSFFYLRRPAENSAAQGEFGRLAGLLAANSLI